MRLIAWPNISNLTKLDDVVRFVSNYLEKIPPILNGGIQFGDNIRSRGPFEFKIVAASQVVKVSHTLGFVPAGYLLVYQNASASIYAADAIAYPWTNTDVYLTASAAVTGRVILF